MKLSTSLLHQFLSAVELDPLCIKITVPQRNVSDNKFLAHMGEALFLRLINIDIINQHVISDRIRPIFL